MASGRFSLMSRRFADSVERSHHVLDSGVFLERVDRHVLAVATLLDTAVGHLVDERDVGVDPDRAELELACHAQRAPDVAGPDRSRQPVIDAVGPGQRLRLVAESLHRHDRPEYLATYDLGLGALR